MVQKVARSKWPAAVESEVETSSARSLGNCKLGAKALVDEGEKVLDLFRWNEQVSLCWVTLITDVEAIASPR